MSRYNEILKSWETPFDKSTSDAWKDLEPKLRNAGKSRVVRFSWKPLVSVAAAAAVIVAVVMIWPKNKLILRQTAMAQTETVTLPDQSTVTLNAGSSISYDDDWSKERTLKLDGQAFFEVIKGGKFSVVTDQGIVEVMGTSFDVFARAGEFRVECVTGKVKVSTGKSEILITPGKAAELKAGILEISEFDLNLGTWRNGEFIFHGESLKEVLDELGRQFGVTIVAPDLSGREFHGRFSNDNLNQALERVCGSMSLQYEIQENNRVIITEIAR